MTSLAERRLPPGLTDIPGTFPRRAGCRNLPVVNVLIRGAESLERHSGERGTHVWGESRGDLQEALARSEREPVS